ncbi:branched-chain amino acid transaminase [Photorhabdus africana]|uniref:branched-chain amino acid transaminase n=1 Tax=Photorhabdus africana TaxID=3097554 RepID=UPI002B414134|nr:branched-chain amino acid transaminase [Photorhabdus sp. CRI-LC]
MTNNIVSPVNKDWIVFLDGEYLNFSNATFLANTQALNYGTGTFEGIRAYWDQDNNQLNLFRVHEHYERLIQSAKTLKIELPYTSQELTDITKNIIIKNGFKQDIYIRPLVLKKSLMPGEKFGVKLSGVNSTLCINALPMGAYAKKTEFTCLISKWRRVSNAAIPSSAKITGTYVNSALAHEDAKENGFDDAIMLNEQGMCAEASTSNVFIVKDNCVITPSLSAGILNGITRQSVFDICQFRNIPCIESEIQQKDLYEADGCFLTGTGLEISIVSKIDDVSYRQKEDSIANVIAKDYQEIIRGRIDKFSHWLNPVY